MLQDLEAGKRLELSPIVDALIELAELTGTDAPSLRAISAATSLLDLTAAGASTRRRAVEAAQ